MPQTVPNKPTKGAVDPTDASTARPDCSRAVDSSIELRSDRMSHSLTSSESCSCGWAWWCAVASRPSSASARNGLDGSVPSLANPSAKSAAYQKLSVNLDCSANRRKSIALMMSTIQVDSDIRSSNSATPRVTTSPWFQRLIKPYCVSMLLSAPGALFKNVIDGRFVPHGLRHAANLARNIAARHDVIDGRPVQPVVSAGAFHFCSLRRSIGTDEHPHHDFTLLAQALADRRVGRRWILQVTGVGRGQFDLAGPGSGASPASFRVHGRSDRGCRWLGLDDADRGIRGRFRIGDRHRLGRWRQCTLDLLLHRWLLDGFGRLGHRRRLDLGRWWRLDDFAQDLDWNEYLRCAPQQPGLQRPERREM